MGCRHPQLLYGGEEREVCTAVAIVDKLGQTAVKVELAPGVDGALRLVIGHA